MNYETAIPGLRLAAGFINIGLFTAFMSIAGSIQNADFRLYTLISLPLVSFAFSITRTESIGNQLLSLSIVDKNNEKLDIKGRILRGTLPILMLHVFTISNLPHGFYNETLLRIISPTISLIFILNGLYIFISPTHQSAIDFILGTSVLKTKKFKPLKKL